MREHKNQDQSPKRTLTLSDAAEFSEPLDAHRLLPGLKPVLEALTEQPESLDLVLVRANLAGKELKQLQSLCQAAAIRLRKVPEEALARLCREDGQNPKIAHQGVIARITKTSFVSLDELLPKVAQAPLPLLVALDQVKDPGNLGAITRTLYTLGGAGLLVPLHNSAALGPQARRTAAGALDKLPIAKVTNLGQALDRCEEEDLVIYGTVGRAAGGLNAFKTSLNLPAVLVLGSEERGLRPEIRKRCRHLLHIPQARDFNSFNVAQAGAILLGLWAAKSAS